MNPFVEILKKEYERRKSKNPAFSMRGFSKFMDMDSSNLNKIMNYKKTIGRKTIQKICEKLNLDKSVWTSDGGLQNAALSKFTFVDDSKNEKYYSFYIDPKYENDVNEKINSLIDAIEPFLVDRATEVDAIRLAVIFDATPKNNTKNKK